MLVLAHLSSDIVIACFIISILSFVFKFRNTGMSIQNEAKILYQHFTKQSHETKDF